MGTGTIDPSAAPIRGRLVRLGSAAMLFGLWVTGRLVLWLLRLLILIPGCRRIVEPRDA